MSEGMLPANMLQRLVTRIAALATTARIGAVAMHHLDRFVMRLTKQRASATSLFTGLPLIWLTTVGAKTGKARTVPLLAIPDGTGFVLVASNWGQQQHPSWYYNLCANPHVRIQQGHGTPAAYTAHELSGEAYERCWALAVRHYAGYSAYRKRTTRQIPVFRLEPILIP